MADDLHVMEPSKEYMDLDSSAETFDRQISHHSAELNDFQIGAPQSLDDSDAGAGPSANVSGGSSSYFDTFTNTKKPDAGVLLDQERFLPIANVVRLMKNQMDRHAKLSKDAKECVQECVSEFITFIASEAAEYCHQTKRKTITADDLLTALEATGFDNYAEPMRIFLMKYRQTHKVTGPIHRIHPNYVRPKQFRNDPPVKPLFFDTEHGRRCTETQYFVNGYEIVKNAPFSEEWNEQTGTLNPANTPLAKCVKTHQQHYEGESDHIQMDRLHRHQIEHYGTALVRGPDGEEIHATSPVHKNEMAHIDVVGGSSDETPVAALEPQHQMQIYVDSSTKQHYAACHTAEGLQLYPIQIQSDPINLTADGPMMRLPDDLQPGQFEQKVTFQDDPPIRQVRKRPARAEHKDQPSASRPPRYSQIMEEDDDDELDEYDEFMVSERTNTRGNRQLRSNGRSDATPSTRPNTRSASRRGKQ